MKKKNVSSLSLRVAGVLLVLAIIVVTVAASTGLASLLNRTFDLNITINELGWILLFSLAVGTGGAFVVAHFYVKPIKKLEKAMNEVSRGDYSQKLQTEKLRLREIKSLYENFNLMTKELSATEILQSDFVSNVSHEFKTPIAAIEGYASLLQDTSLGEEERAQYADRILMNTGRVSGLVENILLISKVENKAIRTEKTEFRLDEQIRKALILLEPKWSEKNMEPEAQLEEIRCRGDESLLMHVWVNLLDNAVKFSPAGGKIRLSLKKEGDAAVFSVTDAGSGIEEKSLSHIFDKFYQGDPSRKDQGNGLGLALVKRILDFSGGSVKAENLPEGGAKFTVTLPLS